MKKSKQFFVISGSSILMLVLMVLFLSPSMLFSPTITIIGADFKKSSADQISVADNTKARNHGFYTKYSLKSGLMELTNG